MRGQHGGFAHRPGTARAWLLLNGREWLDGTSLGLEYTGNAPAYYLIPQDWT